MFRLSKGPGGASLTVMGKQTGRPGPDPRGQTKRGRYNIVLDPEVASDSKKLASKEGESWSTWIENLIIEALKRQKKGK